MNEQTNPAQETILNKETVEEINKDTNAEESESTLAQEKSEQVDFAQMYDMLTERDNTIKELKSEIADLKKSNTNLLLKVNASSSGDASLKTPYESFIDSMIKR